MTHLVISKKLDVLADGMIEMVLSKLVQFKDFTLFRDITTQDVKEHLRFGSKIRQGFAAATPSLTPRLSFSLYGCCLLQMQVGGPQLLY